MKVEIEVVRRVAIRKALAATLLFALLFPSCTDSSDTVDMQVAVSASGAWELVLREPPGKAAARSLKMLEPDLVIDGGFGHLADLAVAPDGKIATLDRGNHLVTVFDARGKAQKQFGRKGGGPGEFSAPLAIASVDSFLVAWDNDPTRQLTAFSVDGAVLWVRARQAPGDERMFPLRLPFSMVERPFQMTLEDVTRRIGRVFDDHFLLQTQDDEYTTTIHGNGDIPTQSSLVRYDRDGLLLDTLRVLRAPGLEIRENEDPRAFPMPTQAFYGARPLWAAGSGWLATAHGDSAVVHIWNSEKALLGAVRWPARRQPVSNSDRLAYADWIIREEIGKQESDSGKARFSRLPPGEVRKGKRELLHRTLWATEAPHVTALFGAGQCLFIAGFAPEDYFDGTSHSLLVVRVDSRGVQSIRIPRAGARIREVVRDAVYTSYWRKDGSTVVERYRIPTPGC